MVDAQNDPDLAALEVFLRSRGRKMDFYSDSSTAYMYDNPNRASDEDICIYSPDTGKYIPANLPQNSKHLVLQRYETQDMIQVVLLALGGIVLLILGIAALMRYGTNSSHR